MNHAMAVRCEQCRTPLIHEAIDQSVKTKKLANAIDTKIFSVIGAGACFALVAAVGILTSQNGLDDPHVLRGALFAAVVGGVIGRWIAKQKDRI
jgi:hypothetical protein